MMSPTDQDSGFWPSLYAQLRGTELDSHAWFSPLASAVADDKEYLIRVEVPGMAPDDITISIQQDSVVLEGTKTNPERAGTTVVFFDERLDGKFIRTFKLPSDGDLAAFTSVLERGVLQIHVPRRQNVNVDRIHPEIVA